MRYQSLTMATKNVIINPPQLNDEIAYSDWKKEIDFWQIATSIKEDKQGARHGTVRLTALGSVSVRLIEIRFISVRLRLISVRLISVTISVIFGYNFG